MSRARSQRRAMERKFKGSSAISPKDARELTYQIKSVFTEVQQKTIFRELPPAVLRKVEGEPMPKQLRELRQFALSGYSGDIQIELNWTLLMIERYSNSINAFIELEKKFNNAFLVGDYASASHVLDVIEKDICFSQWGIERRMLVAEYQFGLYKNKEILSQVSESVKEPLVKFAARFQSLRVEKKLPVYKFESALNEYIEEYESSHVKEYIRFKILGFDGFILSNPSEIIFLDSTSSIFSKSNFPYTW
jgi:hypothetical protein